MSEKPQAGQPIIDRIRELHGKNTLCGKPRNHLLGHPEALVLYVRSLLCGQLPARADAPAEEWEHLVDSLNCHRVLPLLYKKTRNLPDNLKPPPQVMEILRSSYLEGAMGTIDTDRQMAEIIDRFAREEIPIVPLKGAALSRTVYDDSALRQGGDLDFLVFPGDIGRSRRVAEDLGYKCMASIFVAIGRGLTEIELKNTAGHGPRLPLEIHCALDMIGSLSGANVEELLSRRVTVRTPYVTMETLDPVDSLIHAAQHMMLNHGQDIRLIWIYDTALLARMLKAPGDWRALQERSVRYGARCSVETALRMAQLWTGLRLPPGFDDFSLWPMPSADESRTFRRMARGDRMIMKISALFPPLAGAGEKARYLWSLVFLMNPSIAGPGEKARYLWSLVFPPASYMRQAYPPPRDWMLPLSYLYRWIKFARG